MRNNFSVQLTIVLLLAGVCWLLVAQPGDAVLRELCKAVAVVVCLLVLRITTIVSKEE